MFADRSDAGRQLAAALFSYAGQAVTIFALPRGGLPVALEVANALRAPLELLLVRKIGLPSYPELAMGAVMGGDPPEFIRNEDVILYHDVSEREFETSLQRELAEIERRRALYPGAGSEADITGKTAIIIDDGLATGATMRAAIKGLRNCRPARIVVAVPVAAPEIVPVIRREADDVVCLATPENFQAVGSYYLRFPQLTDQDVLDALRQAAKIKAG